ncbi:DNA-binding response OmpR family regulator [Rhizobium tibeticum]|uniref:Swarming motility regulation protein RssB n=1 Tax=Rhizobium tibeticum TaxID=501024 RepID=A0A1H8USZ3_9HYPH|nr:MULTISPECIES: response regulator [Rhizobium]MCA0802250.1 response regulator [Rhizobium sp. T1473]MCS0460377.1 response regulator [Rhizobium favelukesii]MDP9809442.1 DNA-binding response OmpR family regulator [Rhizobium tibeticum]UFS80820.1 response regulator [Rhizobium sp. T136]SEI17918.1 Swarming motility regulation protein RssB [Rhizobium tibeticum]
MNVLLVEDNVLLGDAVRDHIAADGHSVDWCLNLAEATEAAGTGKYGVILLDLRLPDGNGLTLLKALRRQANFVPVIILTAHDQTSDQIEGLQSGADDFLVKPFGLSELSERMKAANRKH